MASPGATSSGSSFLNQNSSSEEDMHVQIVDERKRKRMISNRESARRSRMRKQKHLDDLVAQIENLRKSNVHILSNINVTTQEFLKVESENSILRAQMHELSNRLESLNEINNVLGSNDGGSNNHDYVNQSLGIYGEEFLPNVQGYFGHENGNNTLMNPWSSATYMNQPIMASADMFQLY